MKVHFRANTFEQQQVLRCRPAYEQVRSSRAAPRAEAGGPSLAEVPAELQSWTSLVPRASTFGLPHGDICLLDTAGMNDRQAIYSYLSSLTKLTNSTLYIPALPCQAFSYGAHGLGGTKDCNRPW